MYTLQDQTNAALVQSYASERFIASLMVRGDLYPYFGSYFIGDDCLFDTDDWMQQDNPDGTRDTLYLARILGWKVTPPNGGENSETIEILLAGQEGAD